MTPLAFDPCLLFNKHTTAIIRMQTNNIQLNLVINIASGPRFGKHIVRYVYTQGHVFNEKLRVEEVNLYTFLA